MKDGGVACSAPSTSSALDVLVIGGGPAGSATAIGLAVVWVEFEWGQDIQRARQIVTEKLALAEGSLPPEVEKPFLAPVSSIMGEIMFVALESDRHSPL